MSKIESRTASSELELHLGHLADESTVTNTENGRPTVPPNHIYWCTSHQMYVDPGTRRELEDLKGCEIVRLDFNLLLRLDLHCLSTWISSEHSTRKQVN
jgi:hypothetical protein